MLRKSQQIKVGDKKREASSSKHSFLLLMKHNKQLEVDGCACMHYMIVYIVCIVCTCMYTCVKVFLLLLHCFESELMQNCLI